MFYIAIKKYEDDSILDKIPCASSERGAERVERGVNINLNHDEYYTEIIEED